MVAFDCGPRTDEESEARQEDQCVASIGVDKWRD
jgi:hypothetical protein